MSNKIYTLLFIVTLIAGWGCNKFDDINTDPARPQETEPQFLLANAEKRAADLIYSPYYNCRIGMHFAQYWTGTDKTSESRNLITDDGLWANLYSGPLMDLREISNYYKRHPDKNNPHTIAIANILKAWIFHVLTDVYVDVPYSQALQVDAFPQPEFDRGGDIYASLLTTLKDQINTLKETGSDVIVGDVLLQGDPERWIMFANALRMRIALRMADVRQTEAKTEIEDAVKETMTAASGDVYFPYNTSSVTNRFPYNEAERPMVEFAVTATLVDYLKAVGDPRLPVYARPAKNSDTFRGKTYGVAENNPPLDDLSKPGVMVYGADMKGYMMTYAEVAFIKAEAAARGMNVGGTAINLYEEAVKASMKQWGISNEDSVEAYLNRVPYTAGNWKNVIGTQKWIALYMQGLQAWMERLRLDIKKPDGSALFIAPASGSLDPEVADVPKRLNYPNATRNSNAANSEEAAGNIGGDTKATKNWWDIL